MTWRTHPDQACAPGRVDADLFHGADGHDHSRAQREAAAVAVCRTCPVVVDCAIWAVVTREPLGVAGGLTPAQRVAIIKHDEQQWLAAMRRRRVPV